MRHGPTAILTTTPTVTRVLVRMDDDVVLKAALLHSCWLHQPHPRALPSLLEAMALWYQAPVRAVVSARDVASWSQRGLVDELDGVASVHYQIEMRAPGRRRGQRIRGLGSFADAQQLDLAGVR
jgi:hypothetical protein